MLALLLAMLLPALASAHSAARAAVCTSNLRQIGAAWLICSQIRGGVAMPLAQQPMAESNDPAIYWWGAVAAGGIDYQKGFLAPYLDAGLRQGSVFECPAQPWGSYQPQAGLETCTSTYGYNGYYLCPPATPGWSYFISDQPWKRLTDIRQPSELLVFADTLLPGSPPSNNALLDPPMLWFGSGTGWQPNSTPTTCFRHGGSACCCAAVRADGSAGLTAAQQDWLTHPELKIGSVGTINSPHYVPDWQRW